jgi:hypothetical protein
MGRAIILKSNLMNGLNLRPVKNKNLKVTRGFLGLLSKLFYNSKMYLAVEFTPGTGKPFISKRKWTSSGWINLWETK